ncbi:MAG TPA: DUF4395 domain-containing protein [Pseudonocardiaceae bacterium]
MDPRGPRFAAWVTTAVLAGILLTGSVWLAAAQAAAFALGAFAGLRYSPYAAVFRVLVAPRLRRPTWLEPAAPVRFSQAVGFAFTLVATLAFASGLPVVGQVATGFALAAAALNAVAGVCLACLLFPRLPVRLRRALTA